MQKLIFIALLVAVGFVHAENEKQIQPLQFEAGKTYVYNYRGNTLKGVPNLKDHFSGYELESKVIFESSTTQPGYVTMQLKNILQGHMIRLLIQNENNHDGHLHGDDRNTLSQYLSEPIQFLYRDGHVQEIKASKNEPQWTLNLKRGILSLFNVEVAPKKLISTNGQTYETKPIDFENLTYYGVFEESVAGWCETSYQINHIASLTENASKDDYVVNITKTRNYEHCHPEPPPMAHIDTHSCRHECEKGAVKDANPEGYYPIPRLSEYCTCNKQAIESTVDQFATIWYNISLSQERKPLVESVQLDSRIASLADGDKISSLSSISMTLENVYNTAEISEDLKADKFDTEQSVESGGVTLQIPIYENEKNNDNIYHNLLNEAGSEMNKRAIIEKFNQLANQMVVNDMNEEHQPTELALGLYANMASMKKHQLREIFQAVATRAQYVDADGKEKIQRQLYLDILSLCGSNDAAMLIIELLEENLVSDSEARDLIESVGGAVDQPKMDTINRYYEKCRSIDRHRVDGQLWSALCFTSGKFIRKSCQLNNNGNRNSTIKWFKLPANHQLNQSLYCEVSRIDEIVRNLQDMILLTPRMTEKLSLFEALLNTNEPQAFRFITPYVNGRIPVEQCAEIRQRTVEPSETEVLIDERRIASECSFLRESVIYNLFHLVPTYSQNLKALLLPVFNDVQENYRIRLAALNILMASGLEKHELESIAFGLHEEPNRSVRSMAVKYIQSIVSQPDKTAAKAARDVMDFLPKLEEQDAQSHVSYHTFTDSSRDAGFYVQHQSTPSNDSRLPSTGYVSFGRFVGEKAKSHLAYLGFQQEGIEEYIHRILEPQGVLSDALTTVDNKRSESVSNGQTADNLMSEALKAKLRAPKKAAEKPRKARSVDNAEQSFANLKEKLNLKWRQPLEPKLRLVLGLFERSKIISLNAESIKKWVHRLGNNVIANLIKDLEKGYSNHLVRFVMVNKEETFRPSEMGLPVVVSNHEPLLLSFKISRAQLRQSNRPITFMPLSFNFSAVIEPSVYYQSSESIYSSPRTTGYSFSTDVQHKIAFSAPATWSVGYRAKENLFSLSVVPQTQAVLHHAVKPFVRLYQWPVYEIGSEQVSEKVHLIRTVPHPFLSKETFGHETFGMGFSVENQRELPLSPEYRWDVTARDSWSKVFGKNAETLKSNEFVHTYLNGLVSKIYHVYNYGGNSYRRVKVSVEKDTLFPTTSFDLTIRYNRYSPDECIGRCPDGQVLSLRQEIPVEPQGETDDERSITPEKNVVDYDKILAIITGQKQRSDENLEKEVRELIQHTRKYWEWTYERENQTITKSPLTRVHRILVTAVANGIRPTYLAFNTDYVHTHEKRVQWLKFDGFIKRPNSPFANFPYLFCSDSVFVYPPPPSKEMTYQPSEFENIRATFNSHTGLGLMCADKRKIKIAALFSKVDQKSKDKLANNAHTPWYIKKCSLDQDAGKGSSEACMRSLNDAAHFDKLNANIDYKNIPHEVKNLTMKAFLHAKVVLYEYLSMDRVNLTNQEDKVRINVDWRRTENPGTLVDVSVLSKIAKNHFSRLPGHAIPQLKTTVGSRFGLGHRQQCSLSNSAVRTFDNVTFALSRTNRCQYLLSMDCSAHERYAVFVEPWNQENVNDQSKTVTVLARGHQVKILPKKSLDQESIEVVIDDHVVLLTTSNPKAYCVAGQCLWVSARQVKQLGRVNPYELIAIVESSDEVRVTTDGFDVKVELLTNRFKGLTCGLCSNADGETVNEFEGPQMCQYDTPQGFAQSYSLSGKYCSRLPLQIGNVRCPYKTQNGTEWTPDARSRLDKDCSSNRTYTIEKNNEICFSVKPILKCGTQCRLIGEKNQPIDLTCLERDEKTEHWLKDSKVRVITEVKDFPVNLNRDVRVPEKCRF